jgi:hypothetical protein
MLPSTGEKQEPLRAIGLNINRSFLITLLCSPASFFPHLASALTIPLYSQPFTVLVANIESALDPGNIKFIDLTSEIKADKKISAASAAAENALGPCNVEFVDLTGESEVDEYAMPQEHASPYSAIFFKPSRRVCF